LQGSVTHGGGKDKHSGRKRPMKTILIIDDSETVRLYHSAIFQTAGFKVITAADGADGLEKFFQAPSDVVLTDINMVGMDGYEFIRRLRQEAAYDHIPIIIVSTEAQQSDRRRGIELGATLYLVKPADPVQLVENVRMVLQ
jgi:two-component system chemotaxis response regulator CheY